MALQADARRLGTCEIYRVRCRVLYFPRDNAEIFAEMLRLSSVTTIAVGGRVLDNDVVLSGYGVRWGGGGRCDGVVRNRESPTVDLCR